jgi:hypothetical protein
MAKKKAPKLPKAVDVLGHTFAIQYYDEMINGELAGLMDPVKKVIHVLNDDELEVTLLHEIIHAVLFVSGHSFTLGPAMEEALVRALEAGLGPIFFSKK